MIGTNYFIKHNLRKNDLSPLSRKYIIVVGADSDPVQNDTDPLHWLLPRKYIFCSEEDGTYKKNYITIEYIHRNTITAQTILFLNIPVEVRNRVCWVRQELCEGREPSPKLGHGQRVGQPGVIHIH